MIISQSELFNYLKNNPLNVEVRMGAIEDLRGQDYIVLDMLNQTTTTFDNTAIYQTQVQISILTTSYEHRKALVKYVQDRFIAPAIFTMSAQSDYYVAQLQFGLFLYDEPPVSV